MKLFFTYCKNTWLMRSMQVGQDLPQQLQEKVSGGVCAVVTLNLVRLTLSSIPILQRFTKSVMISGMILHYFFYCNGALLPGKEPDNYSQPQLTTGDLTYVPSRYLLSSCDPTSIFKQSIAGSLSKFFLLDRLPVFTIIYS